MVFPLLIEKTLQILNPIPEAGIRLVELEHCKIEVLGLRWCLSFFCLLGKERRGG